MFFSEEDAQRINELRKDKGSEKVSGEGLSSLLRGKLGKVKSFIMDAVEQQREDIINKRQQPKEESIESQLLKQNSEERDAMFQEELKKQQEEKKVTDKKPSNIIIYDSGLTYNSETKKYNTEDPVLSALMKIESGYEHLNKKGEIKTSPKGAIGIMQLVPKGFTNPDKPAGFGVTNKYTLDDLKNPEINYKIGKQYFYGLINNYKNKGYSDQDAFDLGVMAYNTGPGNIDKYLFEGQPLALETKNYLSKMYKELGRKGGKVKKPEDYRIITKQAGGMVSNDPYKRQPRFI